MPAVDLWAPAGGFPVVPKEALSLLAYPGCIGEADFYGVGCDTLLVVSSFAMLDPASAVSGIPQGDKLQKVDPRRGRGR